MMSITSVYFILFLAAMIGIYYILPYKCRNFWLLAGSFCFYYVADSDALLYLLLFSIAVYVLGILIGRYKDKTKLWLVIGVISCAGFLLYFKYSNFVIKTWNSIAEGHKIKTLELFVPLGISFFVLQAIGYLVDVYRGKVEYEKNVIHLLLFLSFFPYIMSGPIERSYNILPQLRKKKPFEYKQVCHGLQYLLYGYFMKVVVAERFAMVANTVYGDFTYYAGFELLLGTIAYSIQLYCDFAGYSYIAIGCAKCFGMELIQNFKQPYFSLSIGEFWRRWHISLSSWFRDYIYIPLGGNRKGTMRKFLNIIIVFLVSGLWHGANYTYIFWGVMHGVYQVIGGITRKGKDKVTDFLRVNRECFSFRFGRRLVNLLLINTAWIFFRVEELKDGFTIIKRIICGFNSANSFGISQTPDYIWRNVTGMNLAANVDYPWLHLGLEGAQLVLALIGLVIVLIVDYFHYKEISCTQWLDKQNLLFRWCIYLVLIFVVLTFGIYGVEYSAQSFIYANF